MGIIAVCFAATCIITVICPSVFAYMLGYDGHFNQVASLSKMRILISMFAGIVIFTAIFELNSLPLETTAIIFSLNVFFTIISFSFGIYKKKRDDRKIIEEWGN